MSKKNISFILHKPQLSENIGACARAIKNFDFKNLVLINPKPIFPNDKIFATSVGAKDIIKQSKNYDSLEKVISKIDIVIATSARFRNKNIKHINLEDLKKINFKKKIGGLTLVLVLIFAFIYFNPAYKLRFVDQLKPLFSINGYSNFLKETQYGAHRNASVKIFKENLYFGVGIKNFRNESSKQKYENKEYKKTDLRQSTHPHQIHHEFLSETGLFGYISFLIFIFISLLLGIKNYLKGKNLYQLSSIIFIIMTLMPILTSGSFLSTFTSGIFWLNYAIMVSFIQKNKIDKSKF